MLRKGFKENENEDDNLKKVIDLRRLNTDLKCEITNKEAYKMWNAPLYIEGYIDVPLAFAEDENYLLAPTYVSVLPAMSEKVSHFR